MVTSPHRFLKANALSFVVVGGMFFVGVMVGLWAIPVLIVCLGDGKLSLRDFPLEAHMFPHAPSEGIAKFPRSLQSAYDLGCAILGLAGAALFGWAGLRFNHYLIVKKFRWLTQEEAMRTEKTQWL